MGVFGGQGFTLCFNPVKIAKRSFRSIVSTDSSIFWWQPRLRAATCDVSMQMDRRAAAGLIVAAPAAAFASAGDSPKQAYFGTAPMSSPFGEVYKNQGTRLWTELGETERGIFTRIAIKTKQQLDEVPLLSCPRIDTLSFANLSAEMRKPCSCQQQASSRPTHDWFRRVVCSNAAVQTGRRLHPEEGLGPRKDCSPPLHL